MARDFANLPQFLCRKDDIVLVPERPPATFLDSMQKAGFGLPEFVELEQGALPASFRHQRLGVLRPWAWGPDSMKLLEPLLVSTTAEDRPLQDRFNEDIAVVYGKEWSAGFLRKFLSGIAPESWLCGVDEVGIAVGSVASAVDEIRRIRSRGHQKVIVKEDFGSAGQNAVRLWESEVLASQARWMEQSLDEGVRLVIEPWLERVQDFSIQLEMKPGGPGVCGYTGLTNDHRGQFQANWAAPDYSWNIPDKVISLFGESRAFAAKVHRLYELLFASLSSELNRVGYLGPLGVDAFVYREEHGELRLKPVVEVNPRYTMGRLMVELMRHVASGRWGMFSLNSLPMIRRRGYDSFSAYAEHLSRHSPLELDQQSRRIIRGALCLNPPTLAQVCLSTFEVAPATLKRSPD